jgi:hypothetical protein
MGLAQNPLPRTSGKIFFPQNFVITNEIRKSPSASNLTTDHIHHHNPRELTLPIKVILVYDGAFEI